jgi:salicylate hydroxylase
MAAMKNLHVLIIGGGIGGLCLAHGLRHAGISTTVYERTHARTDWLQGYRIHINPHGSAALHACLPAENWQAFLDSVSDGGDGFAFVTEQLRDLLVLGRDFVDPADPDPARQHHGVSRIILRQVLLAGVADIVEFGKTFERYEIGPDGRVTAHCADGSTATGDLLVGADGANSRVRAQLLPHAADRIDTGVVAIAGKYWLTGDPRQVLPRQLTDRVNSVLPVSRGSLFTAVWAGARRPAHALGGPTATATSDFRLDDATPYTFWGYADGAAPFPPGAGKLPGTELRQLVLNKIKSWHPTLCQLVAGSDPETVNLVRVRSAMPVQPWPTEPVTLLGDAIHNMTPMGGIGANTALRDADLLRRALTAVHRGEARLLPAVGGYEQEMLDYGFAAVRRSLRNARMAASANPIGRLAFRAVLRTASAVPPLKRAMFGGIGE